MLEFALSILYMSSYNSHVLIDTRFVWHSASAKYRYYKHSVPYRPEINITLWNYHFMFCISAVTVNMNNRLHRDHQVARTFYFNTPSHLLHCQLTIYYVCVYFKVQLRVYGTRGIAMTQ